MEAQLVASVQQSLGLYLYDNASFMCERLVAEYAGEVKCPPTSSDSHVILHTACSPDYTPLLCESVTRLILTSCLLSHLLKFIFELKICIQEK